jgi:RNA polymerase sigma factor (sigma-70 family)
MDVQGSPPRVSRKAPSNSASRQVTSTGLSRTRIGEALGEWQRGELRLARSFGECRDLAHEQLEDIYQDTAVALLGRSFHSEEHLRNALRWGLKRRALHLHRDDRRRGEIIAQRTPELRSAAEGREQVHGPELAAILVQDRLIVAEFMSELSELEQRVFRLEAEGLSYRAMAPILCVEVNQARKAFRECERKRARFQLLHDTGRLCGYRSHTIQALLGGEGASEQLARGAWAHVARCAHCRDDHRTNARRLRRSFQEQAAALLPIPAFAGHAGWLTRLGLRLRTFQERLLGHGAPPAPGALREGAVATLASGGAAVKIAATGAAVVALAGGSIGATHALRTHSGPRRHLRGAPSAVVRSDARRVSMAAATTPRAPATSVASAQPVRRSASPHRESNHRRPRQPGGFAFLGVPSTSAAHGASRASARVASVEQTVRVPHHDVARVGGQSAGGPFSP